MLLDSNDYDFRGEECIILEILIIFLLSLKIINTNIFSLSSLLVEENDIKNIVINTLYNIESQSLKALINAKRWLKYCFPVLQK